MLNRRRALIEASQGGGKLYLFDNGDITENIGSWEYTTGNYIHWANRTAYGVICKYLALGDWKSITSKTTNPLDLNGFTELHFICVTGNSNYSFRSKNATLSLIDKDTLETIVTGSAPILRQYSEEIETVIPFSSNSNNAVFKLSASAENYSNWCDIKQIWLE